MRRSSLGLIALAFLAHGVAAQELEHRLQGALRPVTAPVNRIEGTLDLRTGKFTRSRVQTIGNGSTETVYDNTCNTSVYLGLQPAGPGGSGSGCPETLGDYGAIPATGFSYGVGTGDAFCAPGTADAYDITRFEIAWCQVAGPSTGSQVLLHFWDAPEPVCWATGVAPTGGSCTAGVPTPTTPVLFSTTLSGLPRNNSIGTLACYVLSTVITPGFVMQGSQDFLQGSTSDDRFAWSFTMPTTTGGDGPILAGASTCAPCVGTIFEVGGPSANAGTGAGQDSTFFWEDYGGSSVPGTSSCVVFTPISGIYLELGADKPSSTIPSTSFCDGVDGSLASCPCDPGLPLTGCNIPIPPMQGGGLTGGVLLQPIAQVSLPSNAATVVANGFPMGSTPSGILFRNTGIDPSSPVVLGDGLICVDTTASPSTFVRLGPATASGGTMQSSFGHTTMAGSGTFYYQLWFRSTPLSYCDATDEFNLSNGITLTW